MKIKQITENAIIFDNGNNITFGHYQCCCEDNYADFLILNENFVGFDHDFDENLKFSWVENEGFLFGDDNVKIFIPCYSEQNGYYSTELNIYYNDKEVCSGEAEWVDR